MKKRVNKKYLSIFGIALGIVLLIVIITFFSIPKKEEKNLISPDLPSSDEIVEGKTEPVLYSPKYSFYNFTDQNENAFSVNIPEGWEVSEDSGLVRPYIDAGVKLSVTSQEGAGFLYLAPYGLYTVPNDLLTLAGFTEGKYYDASNGLANPMLVKKYTEAGDFLEEYVNQLNIETKIIEVKNRDDLIKEATSPLITKQSASEITYESNSIVYKVIAYNYLIEYSGIGIWASSLFGYYSPKIAFNETEYLVLKSSETFKVNLQWAQREAQEVNKRLGIISSTQDSISDTISSSFDYKSDSMDRINDEWSKTILGVEEVYNPETGDTRFVDSGSNYYWMDNRNNIYGTDTDENPFPNEDITKLEIKKQI